MIQLLEYKDHIFHLLIKGKEYQLRRLDLYDGGIVPMPIKLKGGSTLGWNIKGFVSYKKIKKTIQEQIQFLKP